MISMAVLITCHDRREKTLACLSSLYKNDLPESFSLNVFLVDDGCSDGTAQAVRLNYPYVNIISGDGNLYWNGGMRLAFDVAMRTGFDYYLWLNDDTLLYPDAVQTLLATSDRCSLFNKKCIVVGSTQDACSKIQTYGGVNRPVKFKRTTFKLVKPSNLPTECETMNGNCVLIPQHIAQSLKGMEKKFIHAMGDLDYGLRAREAGFSIWVMPGFAGSCSNNIVDRPIDGINSSLSKRFRKLLHPKELPILSWLVFTRRHAGFFWPIYWLWPYAKTFAHGFIRK